MQKHLILHRFIFILLFSWILTSCQNDIIENSRNSFCYWKTSMYFDNNELDLVKQTGANHCYIRYFDVDWNEPYGQALPVASINISYSSKFPFSQYTPSVFITNRTIEKCSEQQLKELAGKIVKQISKINQNLKTAFLNYNVADVNWAHSENSKFDSLQSVHDSLIVIYENEFEKNYKDILIDCDWSENTRDRYFSFLKHLKSELGDKQLEVTLRLWQYKNRQQAGVPPADNCLLMCYNISNPTEFNVKNSIATENDIKPYLESDSYPISLNVALPIFSWSVLFRNGKFRCILSEINTNTLKESPYLFEDLKNGKFRFLTDSVIGSNYLRYGDEIRFEEIPDNELEKIAKLIKSKVNTGANHRITFFSWNENYIKQYGTKKISDYYKLYN